MAYDPRYRQHLIALLRAADDLWKRRVLPQEIDGAVTQARAFLGITSQQCQRCRQVFEVAPWAGSKNKRWCSPTCRQLACRAQRRQKERGGLV